MQNETPQYLTKLPRRHKALRIAMVLWALTQGSMLIYTAAVLPIMVVNRVLNGPAPVNRPIPGRLVE